MDSKNLPGKERTRRIRRAFLTIHREGGGSWGFVVYRTTYSPESATVFPRIMDVLGSFIREDIYSELEPNGRIANRVPNPNNLDPAPNNEVWARYAPIIMDDAQLEGASIDTVRAQFEAWVEARNKRDHWNMYRLCMVIDEEVLQVLKDVPLAGEHDRDVSHDTADGQSTRAVGDAAGREAEPYVKFVEAWPDTDIGPAGYEGWMRCPVHCLYDLWDSMDDGANMGDWLWFYDYSMYHD